MNELTLFNKLFDGTLYDNFARGFSATLPCVDVRETKEAYVLEMDLPGKNENDVHIELDGNILSISSKKEESAEKKDGKDEGWLIKERRMSEFSRRFSLPDDVDEEKVSATFKNGVLTVSIPRKEAPLPKKIAINAA